MLNKEFLLSVKKNGLCGIRCTPHYGIGMVALIAFGETANEAVAKAVKQTGKVKNRLPCCAPRKRP